MKPFFTDAQLNSMSRESMIEIMKIMQAQVEKKETEVQLLKDKQKELEFMNAMLSDQCHLVKTSAVETIQVLLSTMTEEFCSYENGALVFYTKSSITVYLFEFMIPSISRPP